jgi:16S rRNA G966 N2-methylase RsmD
MRYGIPYQGSKSRIAEWVISQLPPADTLVDLFAGGCAITHAALLSGKYNHVIANDLTKGPNVFCDAINGEFDYMQGGITRDEFLASDDDAIKLLYSFGNNRNGYLWSPEMESVKAPAERMLSAPSMHERRIAYKEFLRALKKYVDNNGTKKLAKSNGIGELEGLEGLERLQGLQGLERLQGLEISNLDYRLVDVPEDAVVYADPPYRNTGHKAYADFSSTEFDEWLSVVPFPVYVSEFTCPDGCVEIASKERMASMAAKTSTTVTECLFIQKQFENDRFMPAEQASIFDAEVTPHD